MKTAVHFGAGSVGRGFLGQLLSEGGYEVVFVDVRPDLLAALNARRAYPLRLVSAAGERRLTIGPVRAVDGRDAQAVADAVARADLVSTAVGEAALPHIAGPLAAGLARHETPIHLLICENLPDPAGAFRALLAGREPSLAARFGVSVGLVPCVISRMAPVPDPTPGGDPLEVVAEPYARLPADKQGFVGPPPPLPGLEPRDGFGAYVRLKLYVHNAGHAAVAYHGFARGHTFIHEAMADPFVAREADGVMREGCETLHRADGLSIAYLDEYREDLLERFRNPYLNDTVVRVGRDPARKLGPEDRLVGAATAALAHGIPPVHLARAMAAALRFTPPDDPSAERAQALVAEGGVPLALRELSRLSPDSPLVRMTLEATSDSFA